MAEKSKLRQGLDLLLNEYPEAVPDKVLNTGPWLCIDLDIGKRFAIWTHTGNVYRARGDFLGGEVEDDPFLIVTPLETSITWTCHVCKQTRPDDKISVYSSEKPFGGMGATIKQNVRYCNDNPDCIAKAARVEFVK